MWRLSLVTSAVTALAVGQTFTFTIGSPVASQDGRSKLAALRISHRGVRGPGEGDRRRYPAEGLIQGNAQVRRAQACGPVHAGACSPSIRRGGLTATGS